MTEPTIEWEGQSPPTLFRSAVSGLWYTNPGAAGDVDTVKVGYRQRHIDLPEGAAIVTGLMRKGDLVANLYTGRWEAIDPGDEGEHSNIYAAVCRPPYKKHE